MFSDDTPPRIAETSPANVGVANVAWMCVEAILSVLVDGILLYISFAERRGRRLAAQFRAEVGMPQLAAQSRVLPIRRGQRHVLIWKFHGDLALWPRFAIEGLEDIWGCVPAPMYNLVS